MRTSIALFAAACAALASPSARAQAWPTRPVQMVVPFTAGTTSDVLGRALAEHLTAALGQSVVIENRGGAGGNVGAASVARAEPDGYTILLATTGQAATNKLMYATMTFDPQRDFAPVGLLGKAPVLVTASAKAPVKTLAEAIAYAKANPDKLTAGFPGNGTLGHITGILLQQRAGIKLGQAQYRGTSQIVTDLLGGHIDIAIDSMGGYVPTVQAGELRALAIASAKRWPLLPDVPTIDEAGIKGFEASVWYALLVPAKTPPEIVARLNAALNAYLATESSKSLFEKLGIVAGGGTPADLTAFIDSEIGKWKPIIEGADIKF